MLNVGPDQAGCFPEQTDIILKTFHKWLKSNGEAIYGTTPWRIFGEDFTVNRVEDTEQKPFHDAVYDGTPKDIVPDVRFTMRGKVYILSYVMLLKLLIHCVPFLRKRIKSGKLHYWRIIRR